MDIRKIKKLIELVDKSSISKLNIIEGDKKISIIRAQLNTPLNTPFISDKNSTEVTSNILNTNTEQSYSTPSNTNIPDKTKEYVVRSPMVGIFYRSSHPNNKPFVSTGQLIKVGDILCLIEAMKVMNQIQSDKSGIIQEILVDNGQPVEFDEPLLIIK